jgi:transcriptional regulator with XRE-family HTH domain
MKTKVKKSRLSVHKAKRLTKKQRLTELKQGILICFALLETDHTLKQIADKARLCPSTISRLHSGEFTLAVRFGTVQALAAVAGLVIELTDRGTLMTLVD